MPRERLRAQLRPLWVVLRIGYDARGHRVVEILDLHGSALARQFGRKVTVGEAAVDGEAVGGAGDVADRMTVGQDRLLAHDNRRRVVEGEAAEFSREAALLRLGQRGAAEEVALVEFHGKP